MKNEQIAILVEKVQQDKVNSFEVLYEATYKTVYYFCYKNLGNQQDAQDAMQAVFLALYNNIETLRTPFAFNKFLHTTMRYTCNDFRKTAARTQADDISDYETALEEDNAEFLPREALDNQELRQQIAQLVEALPEKQREAILLFYFQELSLKEIADITHSKIDAVKNRLLTARKTLKERAQALVKKGELDNVMAATPILMTQILQEEAAHVCTPDIRNSGWQNISQQFGLPASATSNAATTAATTTAFVNTAIGVAIAACLIVGVYVAYYAYGSFFRSPAHVYEQQQQENGIDFPILIAAITNRPQFDQFILTHNFRFLGSLWTSYDGSHMLYFLEYEGDFIYLGYIQDLNDNFHVLYQITSTTIPRLSADDVESWFIRQT